MKKIYFFYGITFYMLILQACSSSQAGVESVRFTYEVVQDSIACISAKTTSIQIEGVEKNKVLQRIKGNLDSLLLLNNPMASTLEEDVHQFVQSGLDCQKDLPDSQSCCYTAEKKMRIVIHSKGILSGELIQYDYTGGAHGNSLLVYFNYNTETGNSFTLDQIVKDTLSLKKIVFDKMIAQYNFDPSYPKYSRDDTSASFFDEEFYLTDNFLISSEGLIFAYQQYEIAPYSEGIIQINIPYKEIQDLMKINLN